jgi:hypothetical protein
MDRSFAASKDLFRLCEGNQKQGDKATKNWDIVVFF